MVFGFLERYHQACTCSAVSETKAYLILIELLHGKARALFQSTVEFARTETGVKDRSILVNWLLRTYSTNDYVNQAIDKLRPTRQKPKENYGNYLSQYKLRTLFVIGLDPRIAETICLTMRSNTIMVVLFDRNSKPDAKFGISMPDMVHPYG